MFGPLRFGALIAALVVVFAVAGTASAHDGDELWQIVSDGCVVDQMRSGDPAPCASVDLDRGVAGGYAVFKDAEGARQFLLIPTARITGIESPELSQPGVTNYFAEAWRARSFTEVAAGGALPPDWLSLAVNSIAGRSQDQLHIHIDCLRADVHESLRRYAGEVGPTWAAFPVPLAGGAYDALAVRSASLDDVDPFALLAAGLGDLGGEMSQHTLVVVGAAFPGGATGFLLLTNRLTTTDRDAAAGERLQDHDSCAAPRLGK